MDRGLLRVKSILAVSGINCDKTWTDLGPEWGRALRERSLTVLAQVVDVAQTSGADAIVIVGDLFDRSTVLPSTVEYTAKVFESFSGRVHVAPGIKDWYGDDCPYVYGPWGTNTRAWTTATFTSADSDDATLLGSAWTAPVDRLAGYPTGPNGQNDVRLIVRAEIAEPAEYAHRLPSHAHLITSGSDFQSDDRCTVLEALVSGHPSDVAQGVLIDVSASETRQEIVEFPGSVGVAAMLDVSQFETTEELEGALRRHSEAESSPVFVELTGQLQTHVLLTDLRGREPFRSMAFNFDRLAYAAEIPDSADRTTRAEFLRAMAGVGSSERERHQTTALGLCALDRPISGN